ncbi:MAG: hypothetical protein RLZZ142_181 [Verrucomicrobiota bacterium]
MNSIQRFVSVVILGALSGAGMAVAAGDPGSLLAVASKASAPASGAGPSRAAAPSFRQDVMPVFFRANCNSGGCHGAAAGKDGFHLSLFGYDAAGDYFRLTQQMLGRRVNVAAPEESLLLLKATGAVPHTGGELFTKESDHYRVLAEWIRQGASDDSDTVAEVTGIRVEPERMVFEGGGQKRALKVIASYSDGMTRDMTALSLFLSNNKTTADVGEDGVVHSGRRGATDVFARFNRFTAGVEVTVLPQGDHFEWPADAVAQNSLDEAVFRKLKALRILPSKRCEDGEFLRRATLDLIGLPPTEAEVRAFLADPSPDKRERLVDRLLERPEYADVWASRWADWVKLLGDTFSGGGTDNKNAVGYYQWITEQFQKNVPLDAFLRAQITSRGSTVLQPTTNFYTMLPTVGKYDPKEMAQRVAQLTMGIRIGCAECHNHPFDRWTQDDYYGFVSFFTGVQRKKGSEEREFYVYDDRVSRPALHLLDQRPMPPKFLGGALAEIRGKDPRGALAEWITSAENRLFANSMANRIWAQFFGRGVVEPVDDLRITNPPSNPELFEELGRRLVAHGFDQKKLIREIVTSRTYQLSSGVNASNREDERQFSHAAVRRLPAVTALDAVAAVTDVETVWKTQPGQYRAAQMFNPGIRNGSYFLTCFGQSERTSVDVGSDNREASLSQTLHLIAGDTVRDRIRISGVIREWMKQGASPERVVESLYLRSLCRKPSEAELSVFWRVSGERPGLADYERLWWALLNSTEFLFQH